MVIQYAGLPPEGTPVPEAVRAAAGPDELAPVWRNELGGLTYRAGDRYLKWNPVGTGLDLAREVTRLAWAGRWHPVPEVVDFVSGDGGQLLVTRALPGTTAIAVDPRIAVRAIGEALRALHENLPAAECPFSWSAESRGGLAAPPLDALVVCHGDACAPNTIVGTDGHWTGHVDLGALGLADRWADLAVASMSLGWNFGDGWEPELFAAYGIARDEERIRYYRALWSGSRMDG